MTWIKTIRQTHNIGYKCAHNGHEILRPESETWMMEVKEPTGEARWYCLEHGLPLFDEPYDPSNPMPGGFKDRLLKRHAEDVEQMTWPEALISTVDDPYLPQGAVGPAVPVWQGVMSATEVAKYAAVAADNGYQVTFTAQRRGETGRVVMCNVTVTKAA
jgi:hypothetical protein